MGNINTTKIAAALALLGTVGAHAAVDPASVSTATAELTFAAEAGPVSLSITPEANLVAGKQPNFLKVATVSIIPTLETDTVAIRYTAGSGDMLTPAEINIKGLNDPSHIVNVRSNAEAPDWADEFLPGSWCYALSPGAKSVDLALPGIQTVAADTYIVSMDAGIWTA